MAACGPSILPFFHHTDTYGFFQPMVVDRRWRKKIYIGQLAIGIGIMNVFARGAAERCC